MYFSMKQCGTADMTSKPCSTWRFQPPTFEVKRHSVSVVGWEDPKSYLGPFAKLRKSTINFVTSVRLSVHMKLLGSHWTEFHDIWYLNIFGKSIEKIQVSLKIGKEWCALCMKASSHFCLSYVAQFFFRMRNVSGRRSTENKNTHSVIFFFKSKILQFMR